MSDAIFLADSALELRFILRWNGVAALAIALSMTMTAILAIIGFESNHEELFLSLIGTSILSFPLMTALGHGWLMRGTLKRPTLWGTLTGGGIVAAFAVVIAVAITLGDLWRPLIWQLGVWIARRLGLDAPPSTWLAYAAGGLLFGLILGGMQAAAPSVSAGARACVGLPPQRDQDYRRRPGSIYAWRSTTYRVGCFVGSPSPSRCLTAGMSCPSRLRWRSPSVSASRSRPALSWSDCYAAIVAPAPGRGTALRVTRPKKVACHSTSTRYVG